jgi:hypothetical protein
VHTPLRAEPHIGLEEVDSSEVIVRIAATPESEADGPRLADEILAAISSVTRDVTDEEREEGKERPRAATPRGTDPSTQEYES